MSCCKQAARKLLSGAEHRLTHEKRGDFVREKPVRTASYYRLKNMYHTPPDMYENGFGHAREARKTAKNMYQTLLIMY